MNKRIDNERIPCVYGPPPIKEEKIPNKHIYGPSSIKDRYQRPMPTVYGPPTKKWRSCSVIAIIGALIGGIIAFLFGGQVVNPTPTVYGPPPVDTVHTDSIIGNE